MFNEYVILHTPPPTQPTASTSNATNNCNSAAAPPPLVTTEKTTQTSADPNANGTNSIWQVHLPNQPSVGVPAATVDCSDLALNEALTCQELLAFSVAFSAALPTNQSTLETFYTTLAKAEPLPSNTEEMPIAQPLEVAAMKNGSAAHANSSTGAGGVPSVRPPATIPDTNSAVAGVGVSAEDFSCCLDLYLQVD